jgi:hypothetical protein
MSAGISPADLGRMSPPAAWEGFFLIGLFPAGSTLRWCKVHVFSGARCAGQHCFSALEGLDGPGERVALLATHEAVREHRMPLTQGALELGSGRWGLKGPGFVWQGDFPQLTLTLDEPALRASTTGADVLRWCGFGRMLTYWTAFGRLELDTSEGRVSGVSLVEHAWGGASRWADLGRLGPKRWHWDVLAFQDGSACAALWVSLAGRVRGLRAGGRIPGEDFALGRPEALDVNAWISAGDRRSPARWSASCRLGDGVLEYEATAATPVAGMFPGGGFLGFDFRGHWRRGRARTPLSGTGFTEYRAG